MSWDAAFPRKPAAPLTLIHAVRI